MPGRLADYDAKRDFRATPEPRGGKGRGKGAARFVVQEHSATRLHWDLRLEHDGTLASWALPNGIPWAPKDNRLAVRTEDHPLEYLEFHGRIPAGQYGAGTMTIWDRGTFEVLKWEDRKVEVALAGERVQGRYALFPLDKGEAPKDWMIHRMDPPPAPGPWLRGHEPLPETLSPMLAKAGPLPPEDGRWAYEVKWDGARAIVHSTPGRIRFTTRNGNDVTARYPELHRLNRALSMHQVVLDGEIVAFDDEGRPSFERLQARMHLAAESRVRRIARERPVTFVAFDLLHLDGASLLREPYARRQEELAALLEPGDRWLVPGHVEGSGAEVLAATREQGLEGVIAKRLDSPYEPGRRSTGWVKVKNTQRAEFVIGGWIPGEGKRTERIGALLLGAPDDDGLRYTGRVGTGFTAAELDRLSAQLLPLRRDDSPFVAGPVRAARAGIPRDAQFVEPALRCVVEFVERTSEGLLRAPSYKGLVAAPARARRRGSAETLVVDGREVRLANPDKVLFPQTAFTKADYVDYLLGVAPVLLPHLHDRPLTLKRYPDGVEGQFFYEKNAPSHRPEWVPVTEDNHVLVGDAATLAWLGNLADLELHTPMHRARDPERMTMVVFDLDPGEPAGLLECCQVAEVLRGMFDGLGLRSVVKTSGSKGMQLVVPVNGEGVPYDRGKGFAKAVAELLAAEAPDLVVATQVKAKRKGRVLVDWSQNDRHKTTVCVYSVRARERPTVSTPLDWPEVRDALASGDAGGLVFATDALLSRVEQQGDLFADALGVVQDLPG